MWNKGHVWRFSAMFDVKLACPLSLVSRWLNWITYRLPSAPSKLLISIRALFALYSDTPSSLSALTLAILCKSSGLILA
jgi:hypothetical protein